MKKNINFIMSFIAQTLSYFFFLLIGKVFAEGNQEIDTSVFQDIKPPVNLPFSSLPLIIGLIVLGTLIFAWVLWRFIKKNKHVRKIIEPLKSPDEIAYERLAELLKRDLPQEGKIKQYFIEISDILRRYVEGRFALKAPELTTPEFLEKIKKSDQLNPDHKLLLKEFLMSCDLVKFARYGPSEKEIEQSAVLVRSFIDETKQDVSMEQEVNNAV